MSAWSELPIQLAGEQRGVTTDLTSLLTDLWSLHQRQRDTAKVLAAIETRSRVGVFQAADLAARAQWLALRPGVRHPSVLLQAAEQLAALRAVVIRDRAEEVIRRATLPLVSPYARLAAQVLVTDAARFGTRASGITGAATHKRFVRLRPAHEPRAHSRYEGTERPIDGTWLIAGIEVDGPGDPRLPWSERAWCGHICEYFRR